MNPYFSKILLAIWVLALPFSTMAANSSGEKQITLEVCLIDNELFPLWRKPGEEHKSRGGINIDLMRYIAAQTNLKIHWVRAPFPRCLKLLQSGEVDALNVASYNADRSQYGLYPFKDGKIDMTRRFKNDSYSAFVKQGSDIQFDGEKFTNIKHLPVAIEIGASIGYMLENMNIKLLRLPNIEQAFNMLLAGRVSMVVTNSHNDAKVRNAPVKKLSPPVVNKPYYLMLSRQFYEQHPILAQNIWQASGQMQQSYYSQVMSYYLAINNWPTENTAK
ncbi:MAG: substrate-binding periplasmic protein [Aestuariibacter sp.]